MSESCGQCTPCREGTGWLNRMLKRILAGQGHMDDLNLLVDVANRIEGHTICALGDAAAWPVQSFIKHFRHEFEYMIQHGGRSLVDGIRSRRQHRPWQPIRKLLLRRRHRPRPTWSTSKSTANPARARKAR